MQSAFILGVDSALGSALWGSLSALGIRVEGTTRRSRDVRQSLQHFDLVGDSALALKPGAGVAYLCAGITKISVCEAEPAETRKVNVVGMVEAARQLRQNGKFVVFLSTSAVFDGAEAFPCECSIPRPSSEYGRQKAEVESRLMEIGGVAIVRLTKVVGANEARILDWRNQLVAGCAVSPYKDLFIAPISVTYAVELLRKAGENQKAGIWHGSGEREVSYAEFAMLLADSLGVARSLVEPVASSESGARLTYSPSHAALGMQVTTAGFGLEPQPLEEVISQCVNSREVDSVDNRRGL